MKEATLKRVREVGLLAVLRGPSAELTVQMVDALVAGGCVGIEITYSTPNAPEVVRTLHAKYGDAILLGMGTLTKTEQAREAQDAGAQFLVSPHIDVDLAQAMVATGLPVMIGALTPTEVAWANRLGADVVKIFPGSAVGPEYLKSLKGPFPDIPTMPTGGVSVENVKAWFAAGAVAVGAGSELAPSKLAQEGNWSGITQRAQAFVEAVRAARS
jgi:2-dehydro-3-deoxyphosphogluconate aldolase / (4S)-4-hydroxy-2-oxoglutarate aldolase